MRLVSAKQLCGLSHQRGLGGPENPHAAQYLLPGLSCEPVLPEAEKSSVGKEISIYFYIDLMICLFSVVYTILIIAYHCSLSFLIVYYCVLYVYF